MKIEIKNDGDFLKFIIKCQRNQYRTDRHSFVISIKGGMAYVECHGHEVYIEYFIINEKPIQWRGTAGAAANILIGLGADYRTIEM